jgi:hypothetical protein
VAFAPRFARRHRLCPSEKCSARSRLRSKSRPLPEMPWYSSGTRSTRLLRVGRSRQELVYKAFVYALLVPHSPWRAPDGKLSSPDLKPMNASRTLIITVPPFYRSNPAFTRRRVSARSVVALALVPLSEGKPAGGDQTHSLV